MPPSLTACVALQLVVHEPPSDKVLRLVRDREERRREMVAWVRQLYGGRVPVAEHDPPEVAPRYYEVFVAVDTFEVFATRDETIAYTQRTGHQQFRRHGCDVVAFQTSHQEAMYQSVPTEGEHGEAIQQQQQQQQQEGGAPAAPNRTVVKHGWYIASMCRPMLIQSPLRAQRMPAPNVLDFHTAPLNKEAYQKLCEVRRGTGRARGRV